MLLFSSFRVYWIFIVSDRHNKERHFFCCSDINDCKFYFSTVFIDFSFCPFSSLKIDSIFLWLGKLQSIFFVKLKIILIVIGFFELRKNIKKNSKSKNSNGNSIENSLKLFIFLPPFKNKFISYSLV